MKVTLDTNVIFQAIYSSKGASHEILKLIRNKKIKLSLSIPVFEEYYDVLLRPSTVHQTDLNFNQIKAILDFIAFIGHYTEIYFLLRPNLKDESDNIFIELAYASKSDYLITSNIRDFKHKNELLFDSFKIITPGDFIRNWRWKTNE